jgi:hypothetical protein
MAEMPECVEDFAGRPSRIDDLDANQRKAAEMFLDRLMFTEPHETMDELVHRAIASASEYAPTAREAADRIAEMRSGPAYCYLAFYGLDDTANYMKVGMTRHPESRLYGMATGNPLDCLWVFVSRLPVARMAFHVEQHLHHHLAEHRRRGEWFSVGNTTRESADALARQLHEVALVAESDASEFTLLGYGDGH